MPNQSPPLASKSISAEKKQRKIIHCDGDCFFAAVEMRDDALLKGKPVAVGGSAKGRGVIATCNYEARRFGVHSAMATGYAKKLCPDLILIPPDFEKYRQASQHIQSIFYQYTDLVEPLSLDEAFLDVSDAEHCLGSATLMAQAIKQQVVKQVGITISAGVAPNKFLAKVASDWQKPDGLFVITPDKISAFMPDLPLKKIPGVGKAMQQRLEKMGLRTCADVQKQSVFDLVKHFGKMGRRLHELSFGLDNRPVEVERARKSVSVERTFSKDLHSSKQIAEALTALYEKLQQRLPDTDDVLLDYKGIFVKLKFSDFTSKTMERADTPMTQQAFETLLLELWQQDAEPQAVRLIGIGLRLSDAKAQDQLDLW